MRARRLVWNELSVVAVGAGFSGGCAMGVTVLGLQATFFSVWEVVVCVAIALPMAVMQLCCLVKAGRLMSELLDIQAARGGLDVQYFLAIAEEGGDVPPGNVSGVVSAAQLYPRPLSIRLRAPTAVQPPGQDGVR